MQLMRPLIHRQFISQKSQCGGTVISKHKILTAAHCCINQYNVIAIFNDQIAGVNEADEFQVESQERFITLLIICTFVSVQFFKSK